MREGLRFRSDAFDHRSIGESASLTELRVAGSNAVSQSSKEVGNRAAAVSAKARAKGASGD